MARAQGYSRSGSSGDGLVAKSEQYMGFTVQETGASTAAFIIRAGSATGAILDYVKLAAGQSTGDWFGPMGKNASGGVYLDHVSGGYDLTVFVL